MLKKKFDQVENSIGIKFSDKSLIRKAFVHRSYLNENPSEKESNERLEFLGDAVLEFLVSDHLFAKFPKKNEGILTALRAKLVNATSLAQTARGLNLGQFLLLSRGENASGGRKNSTLLANTLEALIGATYLDQGPEKTRVFIQKFILKKIPEIVKRSLKDPKSMLQEFAQAQGFPSPYYKLLSAQGPDHAKIFTVEVLVNGKPYAQGSGTSKQEATQKAAEEALQVWKKT